MRRAKKKLVTGAAKQYLWQELHWYKSGNRTDARILRKKEMGAAYDEKAEAEPQMSLLEEEEA